VFNWGSVCLVFTVYTINRIISNDYTGVNFFKFLYYFRKCFFLLETIDLSIMIPWACTFYKCVSRFQFVTCLLNYQHNQFLKMSWNLHSGTKLWAGYATVLFSMQKHNVDPMRLYFNNWIALHAFPTVREYIFYHQLSLYPYLAIFVCKHSTKVLLDNWKLNFLAVF
jgi:hypothetical protein